MVFRPKAEASRYDCAVAIGVGGIIAHFYLSRSLEGRDDSLLELIKATEEHQKKAVLWNHWFKIVAILSGVSRTCMVCFVIAVLYVIAMLFPPNFLLYVFACCLNCSFVQCVNSICNCLWFIW